MYMARYLSKIGARCYSTIDNSLSTHLKQTITAAGPLSLAAFMRNCLMHPVHGYYNRKTAIGSKGDFITSPEISQTFGEMCAIWYSQILPETGKFQFLELGPGKGTLLSDILYTWKSLGIAHDSLEQIHLVERSVLMREAQANALGVEKKIEQGREWGRSKLYNADVFWHDSVESVPKDYYTIFMAHEFFDALPIHKFQKTERGWREICVDIDQSSAFVLSPNPTFESQLCTRDFKFENHPKLEKVGSCFEFSLESWKVAVLLNTIVSATKGGGLIIDYGKESYSSNSLRAIGDHKFKEIFDNVGEVDLSVDVDFSVLSNAFKDLNSLGPVSQGSFLTNMGIGKRLELLVSANPDKREEISNAVQRLVGTDEKSMGQAYKVMGVTTSDKLILPFHM